MIDFALMSLFIISTGLFFIWSYVGARKQADLDLLREGFHLQEQARNQAEISDYESAWSDGYEHAMRDSDATGEATVEACQEVPYEADEQEKEPEDTECGWCNFFRRGR